MRTSDLDIFSDENLLNPYAGYQTLRDLGPAVWLTKQQAWALPRYTEVKAALRDHHSYSSIDGLGLNKLEDRRMAGVIVSSDPPDHNRYRKLLGQTLVGRALKDTGAQIDSLVNQVIAQLIARGSFDAVTELAEVIPVTIVADLLGLPIDARGDLLAGAHASFDSNGPAWRITEEHHAVRGRMAQTALEVFENTPFAPGTVGRSVRDAVAAGTVTEWEGWSLFFGLMIAGMDTTVNGIGSALHLLAEHPAQWQKLKNGTADIANAWDEVLRLESPVQLFFRTATRDLEFADGTSIPQGARVAVMFASANRDDAQVSDAQTFDIARRPINHLAFGFGLHVCLGAALARLEGHAVLRSLVRHAETISIAAAPHRRINAVAGGFAHLHIEVAPTTTAR